MLRPQSNRFIGSTRAERRRNMRREQARAVGQVFDGVRGISLGIVGALIALVLLWGLPILYAASSFLVIAMPLRWMTGHEQLTLLRGAEFLGALVLSIVGIVRAVRGSEPIAPVRPVFARVMLGLCWVTAMLLAVADVWG